MIISDYTNKQEKHFLKLLYQSPVEIIKEKKGVATLIRFNNQQYVVHMQYTGLKDKNYIDIFKGDIAKREFDIWKTEYAYDGSPLGDECIEEGYFIGVVSQTPSGLYVLNKCRKYDAEGNFVKKCSGIKLFAHRCEVIGNIYEHPHLLEVAQ